MFQKERVTRGEIKDSTIPNYYKPIKLFCDMNDIIVNWKLVTKGMPHGNHAANDRAPTVEEIKRLLEYPDPRIKPIVLIIISSGIRVGAFDYLKYRHITSLKDDEGKIIAAKMIVYAGEPQQCLTFITPEAYNALTAWIEFRNSYGEKITPNSWVMRDMWKTTNISYVLNWVMRKLLYNLKTMVLEVY
jgi:integrase